MSGEEEDREYGNVREQCHISVGGGGTGLGSGRKLNRGEMEKTAAATAGATNRPAAAAAVGSMQARGSKAEWFKNAMELLGRAKTHGN